MNKIFKILEIFWLLTALSSAAIAIYFLIKGSHSDALYFTMLFLFAGILYLLRKHQRTNQNKIIEKNKVIAEQQQNKTKK